MKRRKVFFLLSILLIAAAITGCSKKSPTESEPEPDPEFTLTVNNQTQYAYDIYVSGQYAGIAANNSSAEMGDFKCDAGTNLKASRGGYTEFEKNVDTRGKDSYTWTLVIPSYTLLARNDTGYNLEISVDEYYIGIAYAYSTTTMGVFEQSSNTHLYAYYPHFPYYYWDSYVSTLGYNEYTWWLTTK